MILSVTSPLFALMGLGYAAARSGYFPADGVKGLSAFVARVAVPVLIFRALAEHDLSDIYNHRFLIAYGLASTLAYLAVFSFARRVRGKDLSAAAFYGMGGAFSNTVMIGFPITTALYGDAAIIPVALVLLVENLFMMPLTLALAASGQSDSGSFLSACGHSLKVVMRNPIVLGITLGIASSALNLSPPAAVMQTIDLLASSVTGVALFAVGALLASTRVDGILQDLTAIATTKLLLHPLLTLAVFYGFGDIPSEMATVAVLLACSPMFSIYPMLGDQYGHGRFCAAAMLPTTLASFATISFFIWLLQSQTLTP